MVRPKLRVGGSESPCHEEKDGKSTLGGDLRGSGEVRLSHSCIDLSDRPHVTHSTPAPATAPVPTTDTVIKDRYGTHLMAPLVNLGYDGATHRRPVSMPRLSSRPTLPQQKARHSATPLNGGSGAGQGASRVQNGLNGGVLVGKSHTKLGARTSWSPMSQTRPAAPIRPRVMSDSRNGPPSLTRSLRIKQWIQARQRSSSQDTTQQSYVTVEEGDEDGRGTRYLENICEESEPEIRKTNMKKSRRRIGALTTRRRQHWQSVRSISPASETSEDEIEDSKLEERLVEASSCWNAGAIREHRINSLRSCLTSKSQPMTVLNQLEANKVVEAVETARGCRTRVQLDVCLLWACLHGATELVETLVKAGANVDARDNAGFSALHLAAESGSEDAVKMLIKNGAKVGGAWEWDGNEEVTPLMLAARTGCAGGVAVLVEAGAAIDAGLNASGETALHQAVRARNPECVQLLISLGATINPTVLYSETALHIAVCEGMDDIVNILLNAGADVRASRGSSKMASLHFAAQEGYCSVAHQLLKAGANPNQEDIRGQTPLHMAAKAQSSDTVQLLLSFGADPNACDRDRKTPLHSGIFKGSRSHECLRLLLESGADSNAADTTGYTPLHMAALHDSTTCVLMFLDHGGDVTACTTGGVSALNLILRRTPTVLAHIQENLDAAISFTDHDHHERDSKVQMDFRVLVPGDGYGLECRMLSCFIREGQKPLLKHPLCEALLFLKWLRVRSFFVFNLIFYALLVASLTSYILVVFPAFSCLHLNSTTQETILAPFQISIPTTPLTDKTLNATRNSNTPLSVADEMELKREQCGLVYEGLLVYLLYFIWVGITMLAVKELFQVLDAPRIYLSSWDNILVWPIIIFSLVITIHSYIQYDTQVWEHHLAAVVVLLSWVELLLIIGRFPVFGLYVQMFTHVTKNFGKFLIAYISLINAFSLSFGVLFPNHPPFQIYALRMLKTLVMMTGEIEYDDWFFNDDKTIMYPGTSHAIFGVFLVFVTIILMNLLVGLAVSDIQGLQKSAALDRLVRQTQLVAHFESFMFSEWLKWVMPKHILNILHRMILLSPSLYGWTLVLTPKTLHETGLPPDLVQIILRNARARDQATRRRNAFANFRTLSKTAQYTSDGDGDVQRSIDALRFGLDLLVWDMDERREDSIHFKEVLDSLTMDISSLGKCVDTLSTGVICNRCQEQLKVQEERGSVYTSCSSKSPQCNPQTNVSPRQSSTSQYTTKSSPQYSPKPSHPCSRSRLSPYHSPDTSPQHSPRCSPHHSHQRSPHSNTRLSPYGSPRPSPHQSPRHSPNHSCRPSPLRSPRPSQNIIQRTSPHVSPQSIPRLSHFQFPIPVPTISPRSSPRCSPIPVSHRSNSPYAIERLSPRQSPST